MPATMTSPEAALSTYLLKCGHYRASFEVVGQLVRVSTWVMKKPKTVVLMSREAARTEWTKLTQAGYRRW